MNKIRMLKIVQPRHERQPDHVHCELETVLLLFDFTSELKWLFSELSLNKDLNARTLGAWLKFDGHTNVDSDRHRGFPLWQ